MVTLLEAARDSEKTYRESIISTSDKTKGLISDYVLKYQKDKDSMFDAIQDAPLLHQNPILRDTGGDVSGNNNTFEEKGNYYLKENEIQEFYDQGYIARKNTFPNLKNKDIQKIQKEYIEHGNKCKNGIYDAVYGKFPDYVAHLYFPSVVKLFKDNYEFIVQKAMSIFNKPEEELFFQAGIFLVDDTEKGANIHYSCYFLDQTMPDIKTSVMTFHLVISNDGASRFYLFPGTHKEILHNLTTLKYIRDHKVPIDKKMEMYAGGIFEYVIDKNQLPYDNQEGTVVTFSHFSRYRQSVYILDKYKTNDIVGYKVDTKPGEFVLFDPATLHSNGASSGNIDEIMKNYEGAIRDDNISRLSLAIRVMHTKNNNHFLWMSAIEKIETLQKFLEKNVAKMIFYAHLIRLNLLSTKTSRNFILCLAIIS